VLKLTAETEIVAFEMDARPEEPEEHLRLKKTLIRLLADNDIRAQLYEAIKAEDALRENRAKIYS
jgi:hypothetical protein